MGKSQESFHKKEVRKRKEKKRKEKEEKRLARKENDAKGGMDDMIAYVDEYGNITSTPPDPAKKEKIQPEDIEVSIPSREDDHDTTTERKGIVTHLNDSKGYGFIRDSETKENVFVHKNDFQGDIRDGDHVTFKLEKGPKGLYATEVKQAK